MTAAARARRAAAGIALLAAGLLAPAGAQARAWHISSPGHALHTELRAGRGELLLTARRAGRVALRADLGRKPRGAHVGRGWVDQRFTTPAGKRRVHRLHARTLTVRGAGGHGLELLVADDGVAVRLRRPGRHEATRFGVPGSTRTSLQRYTAGYEGRYVSRRLRAVPTGRYGFPALLREPHGTAVLLTESGLAPGDSAAHLDKSGTSLRVAPPRGGRSPRRTPWRVALIGDLSSIVASDLPLALGRPSRIRDASWIQPGRVAWSWWADSGSPRDPQRLREYVDLAASMGWEYALVDAGWNRDEIPGLVEYARARGVRLLLWFDWHDLSSATERRRTLDWVAAVGVAGVKVDYLLSDRAPRIRLYDETARAAAIRRLVVDFHGCTLPRGLQRTWPNVLTSEGVLGAEYARGSTPMSPAHTVDLVFTRNVVGSMDFTPVAFSARNRLTSDAHELAEAVAFESGLQHYADTPESFAAHPGATAVLRDVPAAWDDTRLVAGTPGRDAAVARRSGERWWIGALSAGAPRELALPLRFLARGRGYRASITTDGPDGLVTTEQTVTRATTLRVPAVRDGGAVVRLDPLP